MKRTVDAPRSRASGLARISAIVIVIVIASAAGACSQKKSDKAQAADALSAGLKAQNEGRTQDAVKDYQKALVQDPRNKFGAYNLGLLSQLAGGSADAERHYRTTH